MTQTDANGKAADWNQFMQLVNGLCPWCSMPYPYDCGNGRQMILAAIESNGRYLWHKGGANYPALKEMILDGTVKFQGMIGAFAVYVDNRDIRPDTKVPPI